VYDFVTHACILTPKISIPEMLLKSGTNALQLELPGESFWFTTQHFSSRIGGHLQLFRGLE
jgi:hypothetical protein